MILRIVYYQNDSDPEFVKFEPVEVDADIIPCLGETFMYRLLSYHVCDRYFRIEDNMIKWVIFVKYQPL